ncbi:membrane protein insertion efficiency factor YidD [Neoroseomonas terrae]
MSAAGMALKGCVHAYRYTLRGVIGSNCRFYPTCSDYALDAISTHGAARGAVMSAKRILRCNPWNPGGYDPVPLPPKG